MGPWYHRLGRGVDTSPVDATPWVPRAHGREETYQADLEDWDRGRGRGPRADPRGWSPTSTARAGRRRGSGSRSATGRSSPSAAASTLPAPTNDPDVLADAAVSLLDRVEHDRPVRLLGVRLEMAEPEGGY